MTSTKKYSGYKSLDQALKEHGDRNIYNWEYCGSPNKTLKYDYAIYKESGIDYDKDDSKCICGVSIINVYLIRHKTAETICIIGSKCIQNWLQDDPLFNKQKCKHCEKIMKKRNTTGIHGKCLDAYEKAQEQKIIDQKIANNICLGCDKPVRNKLYQKCFNCKYKLCGLCKKGRYKVDSKYDKCFKCHEKNMKILNKTREELTMRFY